MALTDELVNKLTWKIPNALALIGSRSGEERNGMTASWISQLSMEPVLIGVSVENTAVTHRLISEGGSFTVNLWDAEQTRVFVKFSKPAAYADGTLNGRPVREGHHRGRRSSPSRSPGGSFTVNLWDAEQTRVFVKFSKPAAYADGTLNGRPVREATTGAPVFTESIAWLDCEVRHALDLGTHTSLFVGDPGWWLRTAASTTTIPGPPP